MDGDVLPLSSSSSLPSSTAAAAAGPQTDRQQKPTAESWSQPVSPSCGRRLSTDEQVTLITESMTVTSTDQEKLLLLDRNTELRRINKELMKLNEEWDQVYRSATFNLQQKLEALELENSAIKTLNSKLLLKVEHQQSSKDYYEQALMQELKKNQDLQDYIMHLESRLRPSDQAGTPAEQGNFITPSSSTTGNPPRGLNLSPSHSCSFIPAAPNQQAELGGMSQSTSALGDSHQEVQDLKEQLQAVQCQTQIYKAEFQTEHNNHKHTLHENRRLRKKREEMRQQVVLLQEQIKVYEDDFRRERSDKQMLQRLLLKKTPQITDPVLIHRCNNEQRPADGDKRTQSEDRHQAQKKRHHPLCPKHQGTAKDSEHI